MARKCFMCGGDTPDEAILCAKCDKPRKQKSSGYVLNDRATVSQTVALPPELASGPMPHGSDSSPATAAVINVLSAAGVAGLVLGSDKSIRFVSDEARRLFGGADFATARFLETNGIQISNLASAASGGTRVGSRTVMYNLVPLSNGAHGAVVLFRPADLIPEKHVSFETYLRETVTVPMKALSDGLKEASAHSSDAKLANAAAMAEQILFSLQLAPSHSERSEESGRAENLRVGTTSVNEVVQRIADRYQPFAGEKGVELEVDTKEIADRVTDHEQLAESLGILMENAIHYTPPDGQVVIGVRSMDHKGKPLLLFFVMDNGPMVPEELKQKIFEPSFVWNSNSSHRTGRGLSKVKDFATAHGGSVMVESKTGKTCTFFLRVRPDEAR